MGRGGVQAKTQVRRLGGMAGVTPGRTESDGKFRRRAVDAVEERLKNANRDIQDARRGKGKRGLKIKDLEKQRQGLANKLIQAREGEQSALKLAQEAEAQRQLVETQKQLAEARTLEQSAQRQRREKVIIELRDRMNKGGETVAKKLAEKDGQINTLKQKEEDLLKRQEDADYAYLDERGAANAATRRAAGLKGNLRGLQKQLRIEITRRTQLQHDMELIAARGGDTTLIQQQLNHIDISLQQLNQHVEVGGGRVRYGADGMPFIYNPQNAGGGGSGGGKGGGEGGGEGKGPGGESEPAFLKYLSPSDRAKWAKAQAGIKEEKKTEAKAKDEKESPGKVFNRGVAEAAGPAVGHWFGLSFGAPTMLLWVIMAGLAIVLFVKIMGLI